MSNYRFSIKETKQVLPTDDSFKESFNFLEENEPTLLGLSDLLKNRKNDEDAKTTSLFLFVADDRLGIDDVGFLHPKIQFKTKKKEQFLTIYTDIFNDPIISQHFELSGIKCDAKGVIAFAHGFDAAGNHIGALVTANTNQPVDVILPIPKTSYIHIAFKIPPGKKYEFKLRIKNKNKQPGQLGEYEFTDPQVGNDP